MRLARRCARSCTPPSTPRGSGSSPTAAQDARRWAEEIAADGYLPKPFRLVELLDAVERYAGPPGA